jgi:hypothetical protein
MVVQRLLMNYVGGEDDGWEGVLSLFISLTLHDYIGGGGSHADEDIFNRLSNGLKMRGDKGVGLKRLYI